MQTVKTKIKDWKPTEDGFYETPEGVKLQTKQLQDVCEFHKIPQTLLTIDKKYHTNTFIDVAKTVTEEIEVLIDSDNSLVQVLDPKSNFVTDEHFYEIGEMVTKLSGLELKETNSGFNKTFEFQLPANAESDTFVGDLFQKSVKIDRLPQGGVNLSTWLLRLICTNGATAKDSQYYSLIRSGQVSDAIAQVFVDKVQNLNLNEYFKTLFYHKGEPVIATVADYLGMRDTLKSITDLEKEALDAYFPVEPLQEFYDAQNIDITKLNRNLLNRLPAGLKYFEAWNILTNGAKLAEKSIRNEMKVADWARNTRMTSIQASDLVFTGMPQFSQQTIHQRMGDI